jgi:hypothetical protein
MTCRALQRRIRVRFSAPGAAKFAQGLSRNPRTSLNETPVIGFVALLGASFFASRWPLECHLVRTVHDPIANCVGNRWIA